ncbi:MAG: Nitrogen permease regulator 3 [Candelina mexicana]|nr:MAG: Nitrogen permease regulator 3 [Candelina mexicana]
MPIPAPTLPPNPCLVAILLIVSSGSGPRFVFHYPPNAREDGVSPAWRGAYGNSSLTDDSSTDSDQEWSSDNEDTFVPGVKRRRDLSDAGRSHRGQHRRSRNPDDDEDDSSDSIERHNGGGPAWDKVLGFSANGLEKILSPARAFSKKKFELTLDPLVFLCRPVFVRDDGEWRKRKQKRRRSSGKSLGTENDGDPELGVKGSEGVEASSGHESGMESQRKSGKSAWRKESGNAMSMFNIVFVLNPPALEYQVRVKEMYENVAKKFAKALKWEQARSNYVWKESKVMLSLKEDARDNGTPISSLWNAILSKSALANAITKVFTAISASKIAHVVIGRSDVSLQIPQITSTPFLPSMTEPQMPGLWLTTANGLSSGPVTTQEDDSPHILAKHFALLLLDDVDTILKDVSSSGGDSHDLSGPLAHYIRCSKPTLSFLQVSTLYSIPLPDIQLLASHLVYWRRARAIPPLHQRDTYIVSPNCDVHKLSAAIPAYAARFPTLPSLPKMLSLLSGTPKMYGSIIPSKDHRPAYLDILAWLLRGGWVTQLRAFAWVNVPTHIKEIVHAELKEEEKAKAEEGDDASELGDKPDGASDLITPSRGSSLSHSYQASDEYIDPGPPDRSPTSALQPPLSPTSSVLSNRTAIPIPNQLPPPAATATTPSTAPSLILSPHRANSLESRYLDAIGLYLQTSCSNPASGSIEEGKLMAQYWSMFIKYFNGQHALEKIAVREGMKRKEVWRVLGKMDSLGVLCVVRHW